MNPYRGLTFQIEGLKELEAALMQLSKATGKTVLRNALKKAAAPIAEAAKENVPVDEGRLKESISVNTRLVKSQQPGGFRDRTAVNVHVGADAKNGPHAHLVEFGTKPRFHKKSGKYVGMAPAQPFLRPAWDANKEKALKIFAEQVWHELVKVARRMANKAAKGTLGKRQVEALLGNRR
jgi:HK97 gp10 family phage protein